MIHVELSAALVTLFEEQFLKPANELFESGKIGNPTDYDSDSVEAIAIRGEHRKTLINFGRGDFKNSVEGIKPEQLVDLYCYYYFQMHFSSSYAFYANQSGFLHLFVKDRNVLFIDIGCGPFTSGLAFNQWVARFAKSSNCKIDYFGADTSKSMLKKSADVIENIPDYFYNSGWASSDKNTLFAPEQKPTDEYLKNRVVIINFSYVFGSDTLTVPEMVEFTNKVVNQYCTAANEKTFQCIILQQNPDYESLNKKWTDYKMQLKQFTSAKGYPQLLYFSFDDLFGNFGADVPEFNVKCDVMVLK